MLFNSYIFLFAFLPLALILFFACSRIHANAGRAFLVASSFVFYGWWNWSVVAVLAASVAFNYAISLLIEATRRRPAWSLLAIWAGISGNLLALGYYKYLSVMVAALVGAGIAEGPAPHILLPLGISFFTFTQIGYLVDCYDDTARERGPLNYLLFVTFFPHLIAGPILHHREVMPQFARAETYRPNAENIAAGLSIFVLGLLKKVILADPLSAAAAPGFSHPEALGLLAAWGAALSYSLQLYFDFSGYSDMAIGLARMFNIRFPANFNSPYKAASIIEYWQRWHMSLTRFLNLYLYNPIALRMTRRRLAGGRKASKAAYATLAGFGEMVAWPTMATMALAGVWHGAGLQFLIFGLLHGVYLCVNHAWRIWRPQPHDRAPGRLALVRNVALTYLCVLVGAIFFRANSSGQAVELLGSMIGLHGLVHAVLAPGELARVLLRFAALYAIVWLMPNTQQIMRACEPVIGNIAPGPMAWLAWRPSPRWSMLIGAGAALALLGIGGTSEFLYFQF
jgi:alginate O-acetyltransferase complex protein AlgI